MLHSRWASNFHFMPYIIVTSYKQFTDVDLTLIIRGNQQTYLVESVKAVKEKLLCSCKHINYVCTIPASPLKIEQLWLRPLSILFSALSLKRQHTIPLLIFVLVYIHETRTEPSEIKMLRLSWRKQKWIVFFFLVLPPRLLPPCDVLFGDSVCMALLIEGCRFVETQERNILEWLYI